MRNAALLLLIVLAGCANGNKRLDTLAYVPDRVDGSYQGTLWLTSGPGLNRRKWWITRSTASTAVCPATTYGIVTIGDHTLYYAYAPNLTFNVAVKTDGTLHQKIGAATIDGTAAHDRLAFDVVTPICTSRFVGAYKLNHS